MTRNTIYLTGFVILKFILQYFVISPEYELHRDEFLYLDQGNHLAWGYLSVPPATSWMSALIKFLGNSEYLVKFFPALFGVLTLVVVWKSIKELSGNTFALLLGASCVTFSVIVRLNTLYQPNSLDVLCWTAFYYVVIKYISSQKRIWLFAGAIVFAIGFLNKYNIAFLLIGLFPALLITNQRRLLRSKFFYLAIVLCLVLILPNLLWQYHNNFPVITHLQELSENQLVNVDRIGFLKSQVLFFLGSWLIIISGLYALLFYQSFQKFQLFFWAFIFTLLVFLLFRGKDYYAIGLYPIYFAFGAVFLERILNEGWKKYLRPVAISLPIISFIPMYLYAFPNKSPQVIVSNTDQYKTLGLLRWEDGKHHSIPQDFADMLGWKELAQKVDDVHASIPNSANTLVLCDNYGQAGAINFYTKRGLQAVSFNADYINWFNLDQPYTNLIRIKNHWERKNELLETSPFFQTAIVADSITNKFARENGTTIFKFVGAKVNINERIRNEIEEKKN